MFTEGQADERIIVCMYGWMDGWIDAGGGEKDLYDTNLYPKYAYTHVRWSLRDPCSFSQPLKSYKTCKSLIQLFQLL